MILTQAQKTTLKNAIANNANTIDFGGQTAINALPNTLDANNEIALQWYNQLESPAFTVTHLK